MDYWLNPCVFVRAGQLVRSGEVDCHPLATRVIIVGRGKITAANGMVNGFWTRSLSLLWNTQKAHVAKDRHSRNMIVLYDLLDATTTVPKDVSILITELSSWTQQTPGLRWPLVGCYWIEHRRHNRPDVIVTLKCRFSFRNRFHCLHVNCVIRATTAPLLVAWHHSKKDILWVNM